MTTLTEIRDAKLKASQQVCPSSVPYLRDAMDQSRSAAERAFSWQEAYNHTFNELWAIVVEKKSPQGEVPLPVALREIQLTQEGAAEITRILDDPDYPTHVGKEMSTADLDKIAPLLSECELAIAVNACRRAGAVNAAEALSKHITRMQIELDIAKKAWLRWRR